MVAISHSTFNLIVRTKVLGIDSGYSERASGGARRDLKKCKARIETRGYGLAFLLAY